MSALLSTTQNPREQALKQRLQEVEQNLSEARERRTELKADAVATREAFAAGPNKWTEDSEAFKVAAEAAKTLARHEEHLTGLQGEQTAILRVLSGQSPRDPDALRALAPGGLAPGWATADILSDPDVRRSLDSMASATKLPIGRVSLGQVADRETLAASMRGEVFRGSGMASDDITGTAAMRLGSYVGVVPQLRRQFRILDLIPVGTTDGNVIPYTQEGGTFLAAETTEAALKPEDGATYTDKTAVVETIAAWQKLLKQALSDFPALESMINSRLQYSVFQRLENQIVAGNGTAPNLLGIMNTSGIGSVAFDGTVPAAELILDGMVNVFLALGEANAIVMNPLDWKTVLTQKAQYTALPGAPPTLGGSGDYVGGGPFAVTPQMMWGVPLIPSPVLAQGTALVADFARGAQLFIREGVNVLISDSDQDDFLRNKVTILAEMRAALACYRTPLFQLVHLA